MKKTKKTSSARTAARNFAEGCRCSEAILSVYGVKAGLSREQAMKIGCALGGGLGSRGDLCGAVAASIIVLGLKHGRTEKTDSARRLKTDRQVQKFLDKFRSKHGHIRCNDLIGFDRSTPEGHDIAAAAGVFKKLCPKFVEDAALLLEKLSAE